MQAAFVSIGLDRDAFLYVEDAVPPGGARVRRGGDRRPRRAAGRPAPDRPRIDDLVKEGQEIVVQVTKDPIAAKGPRVTAAISLPGRTLVYLPGGAGVRRLAADHRRRPSASVCARILEGFRDAGGLIARTAALGSRRRSSPRTIAT